MRKKRATDNRPRPQGVTKGIEVAQGQFWTLHAANEAVVCQRIEIGKGFHIRFSRLSAEEKRIGFYTIVKSRGQTLGDLGINRLQVLHKNRRRRSKIPTYISVACGI